MTVILQVSDPHFGSERPAVVDALVTLSQELAPDLVVLSGDLTQRARTAQFAAAAAFAQRLNAPRVLAIPGNHDIPLLDLGARLFDPYARYRRAFGADLQPSWSTSDCLVLGVKTTRRYRHVDGEVSAEQRLRVAGQLRAASPGQLRVLVLHHPVAVPRASEQKNVLHGSEAAVRAWSEAGADIVLAGHIHLPFVLPLHETFSGLAQPIWAINAGTSVSSRVRHDAGNSVNVLRTGAPRAPRSCTVEEWTYSEPRAAFVCKLDLRLA